MLTCNENRFTIVSLWNTDTKQSNRCVPELSVGLLFTCYLGVCGGGGFRCMPSVEVRGHLVRVILSFHGIGPRVQTQIIKFDCLCLYTLRYCAGPLWVFWNLLGTFQFPEMRQWTALSLTGRAIWSAYHLGRAITSSTSLLFPKVVSFALTSLLFPNSSSELAARTRQRPLSAMVGSFFFSHMKINKKKTVGVSNSFMLPSGVQKRLI